MQIFKSQSNNVNFKRIHLSPVEERKVHKNLLKLAESYSEDRIHSLKMDLFEMFDPLFHKELSYYSKLYNHKDDLIQGIYVRFFELLNCIQKKEISALDFLENINKIVKPHADEKKENEYSLDSTIRNSKITYAELLTEDKLPVYASAKSDEENKAFAKEYEKVTKDVCLTKKEGIILDLKRQGKNFEEIAKIINSARSNIGISYLAAIAKIQQKNGVLPEKYIKDAEKILEKYSINNTEEEIIDILVKRPLITRFIKNGGLNNVSAKAEALGLKEEEFIKLALKQTSLFFINSEILNKNINTSAQNFGITREDFIKLTFKLPALMIQNPETLKQNVIKSAKILNISEDVFIKTGLKYPSIFSMKPETLKQNIVKLAKILKTSEKELITVALKDAHLFFQKPEVIKHNISECIRIFRISEKEFIKAGLRATQLFYQKPETLEQNISQSAKIFNITEKEFIKAALNSPCLFYQKPETLKENVSRSSRIFNISEGDYVKVALILPSLFYSKPDSLKEKVVEMSKILEIEESQFIKIALIQPRLLCLKPETLKINIKLIADSFGVTEQAFIKEALKRPSLFCFNPESINKKIDKYKFYTKVSGKELENFTRIIRNKSDEFFERSLFYFIKKDLGNKRDILRGNFVEKIQNHPDKIFTFDLPQHECTEEFIQYVKDFFAKNIGTQNYRFIIDCREVK